MDSFEIDDSKIRDFSSFVAEMKAGFIDRLYGNVRWNGNLDALNDYLSWPENKYRLVFKDADNIRNALHYPETIRWFAIKLVHCHPDNRASVREEISMAEKKQGQGIFNVVL